MISNKTLWIGTPTWLQLHPGTERMPVVVDSLSDDDGPSRGVDEQSRGAQPLALNDRIARETRALKAARDDNRAGETNGKGR